MNCEKCGAEIEANVIFCSRCGEKIQTSTSAETAPKNEIKSKKGKWCKKVIAIITFAIIISIVGSVLFGLPNRKSEIEYTKEDVMKFCEILVKNVRNGDAEIYECNKGCAKIKIKLNGYQEETVWVYFDNINETDKVKRIYFRVDGQKENFYNCSIAIGEAIERTVCGKSKIKQYADYEEVERICRAQPMIGGDTEVIGEYSLSAKTKSKLYCWAQTWYYEFVFTDVE